VNAPTHCQSCWWRALRDAQLNDRPHLEVYRDLVTVTHAHDIDQRRVARALVGAAFGPTSDHSLVNSEG